METGAIQGGIDHIVAILCVAIGILPQQFYQLLPFEQDYAPNTPDHIVTQFQILLFSGAAFFLFLKYYGWHLVNSLTLDFDWLYRVLGKKIALSLTQNSGSARDSIIDDLSKGGRSTIQTLQSRHGPSGILGRTMPTGRMAFWAIVMLAIYLLVDFVYM